MKRGSPPNQPLLGVLGIPQFAISKDETGWRLEEMESWNTKTDIILSIFGPWAAEREPTDKRRN
jgi:hypothetical protein